MPSSSPEIAVGEPTPPRSLRRWVGRLVPQAVFWVALTFTIAAMLVVGGPYAWNDALIFSSGNWLPWVVLTPLVFWMSKRFPLVRGHLARGIAVHVVACLACSFLVSTIAQNFPLRLRAPNVIPFSTQQIQVLANETVTRPLPPPPGAQPGEPTHFTISQANVGAVPFTAMSGTIVTPALAPTPVPTVGYVSAAAVPFGSGVVIQSVDGVKVRGGQFAGFTFPPPPPAWRRALVPLAIRANVGFAVYLIVAAAAHAMAFYRQAKERERQALALVASRNQAKLDALRLQLQPHFLFNTLNAIATLVHRDPRAADRLIGDLSDLLRVSLQTTQHEVTLASELELLDHYLAIEQARLGDRLHVVRDIEHAALAACVPPLLLQPLAENAIRHGFEPRLEPGTLTIEARREGDRLRLTVADDGVGLHAPTARSTRRGIGLANTRERLRTLHGDAANLEFTAPLEGGVRAEIVLPFRTAPQHAPAPADNLLPAVAT